MFDLKKLFIHLDKLFIELFSAKNVVTAHRKALECRSTYFGVTLVITMLIICLVFAFTAPLLLFVGDVVSAFIKGLIGIA